VEINKKHANWMRVETSRKRRKNLITEEEREVPYSLRPYVEKREEDTAVRSRKEQRPLRGLAAGEGGGVFTNKVTSHFPWKTHANSILNSHLSYDKYFAPLVHLPRVAFR